MQLIYGLLSFRGFRSICEIRTHRLRECPVDCVCLSHSLTFLRPADLVSAARPIPVASGVLLQALLPPAAELDRLLPPSGIPSLSPLIAISDPLSLCNNSSASSDDVQSTRTYIRCVLAGIQALATERDLVTSAWLLPHIALLSCLVHDQSLAPGDCGNLFGAPVAVPVLESCASTADGLISYIMSILARDLPTEWHAVVIAKIDNATTSSINDDYIQRALLDLSRTGRAPNASSQRRAFSSLLASVFRYCEANAATADQWFTLAQRLQTAGA